MKKIVIFVFINCFYQIIFSQIIFQEKFNNLTLSTHTTLYTNIQYTTVPSGYEEVSEGYKNNVGSSLHPNAPFHTDNLKNRGWGILYNSNLKDTFLVSTSWVDTNKAISRWILLPVINGISVNSVLHWKAMAPDPSYADGYAVYVSANTSATDTTIFNASNKVFQINDNSTTGGGEKQQWTTRCVSLASYSGKSIRIAFKNISSQKYQLWIDDIVVENLPYAYDVAVENPGNTKYVLVNQAFNLKVRIKNAGYQNISNINMAYNIQGISYNNQNFTLSGALSPLSTTNIAFTNTLSINTAGIYKVKIWIHQVNGQVDQNHFNDTVSYYLSVLNNSVPPKILLEQLTDASMPDAPANQDSLQSIIQQDTNVIVVQVHQQDSLKNDISNLHSKYFGVPQNQLVAMINRRYVLEDDKNYFFRNELRSKINQLKNDVVPCNISISNLNVNTVLRTVQFDVNVKFHQNTCGDYRVNAYLVENNICGDFLDTGINGYNQLSSFYFTPYSAYYQQGYYSAAANAFVLNAYQYKHQFVLNDPLLGLYGDASVIPNNTVAGSTYTKTYTTFVTTPTNNVFRFNFDNMYLLAFVYEHDTIIANRRILNATKVKLTNNPEIVTVPSIYDTSGLSVYPNPASEFIIIRGYEYKKYRGKIINLLGEEVLSVNSEITDVSGLLEGIYFIVLYDKDKAFSKKLVIQRR